MWIQQLHSLGLLHGSFLPDEYTRQLQTYTHHRQSLVAQSAKYALKMQKALRLMNVRLDVAIRDITEKNGNAIISAILAGERDAYQLADLADIRIKKSKEEIAASLQGEWREDLLFLLKECHAMYHYYREKIMVVDQQIEMLLTNAQTNGLAPLSGVKKKKPQKNDPGFDLRQIAYQIFGVDLYQIDGISHGTVLSILSTLGSGIHKFPSVKHFVSWLRLAPNNRISGGKRISSRTPKGKNQLTLALRQAANAIGNTKNHPLRKFFSRIAYKKGTGAAITATARKLAAILFHMLTKKETFNVHDHHQEIYERERRLASLRRVLTSLNLTDQEIMHLLT